MAVIGQKRSGARAVLNLALAVCFGTLPALRSLAVETPLTDPSRLWQAKQESVHRLGQAKVMLVDYDLVMGDLRKAHPEIRNLNHAEIDNLLERYASIISQAQVAQQVVNTEIPVDGRETIAHRPNEYRRAHVLELDLSQIAPELIKEVNDKKFLVDSKGSGGENPTRGFSRNGIAMLSEMIRDFLFEKMVKKVFRKIEITTGKKYDTVGSYAVMDAGFNMKLDDGRVMRAGLLLRQAHVRHHIGTIGARELEDPVVLPNEKQLEIEMELRKFGVTSTIHLGPNHYNIPYEVDQLNVQGAEDMSVVDYGSFRVRSHFERPIAYSYTVDGHATIGEADIAMRPNDPRFVQPDPKLQIPVNMWGDSAAHSFDDNPFEWSEHLAIAVMNGHADRAAAEKHFNNFLAPVDEKLFPRGNCRALFAY